MSRPGPYDAVYSLDGFEPQTHTVQISTDRPATTQDVALIDIAGPAITNVSEPLTTSDATGPYADHGRHLDYSAIASASLIYRVDGGDLAAVRDDRQRRHSAGTSPASPPTA